MKVTHRVIKNKVDIASENLFVEHIPAETRRIDQVIVGLGVAVVLCLWWIGATA